MEVVCDGQAEEVATNGKQRWPLSPSTTLRLSMSQPSTEASSDKVPGWGSPPTGRGSQRPHWTRDRLDQSCPIETGCTTRVTSHVLGAT